MAVIVGPDGPSLGGFVAIAQVIAADRWRLGQFRAGDEVRLEVIDVAQARSVRAREELMIRGHPPGEGCAIARPSGERVIAGARPGAAWPACPGTASDSVDGQREGAHGALTFRRAGEAAVLVEFGAPVLDLRSRVRAHSLCEALASEGTAGLGAVTPGVRSLHVQFDPDRVRAGAVMAALERLESQLPAPEDVSVDGRLVYLPLAWRHSEVMRAVERYESSVRPAAPWCPDNIDFIRRINGLEDESRVRDIVLSARYLILGLGDVYLGAPVAVPLDPCHRLVTTKYNPARTWTPANAVGIGGALLCVYGIDGPGGYQLVGRTVQVWHPREDPPWRLRHFDQLRFEAVAEIELEDLRSASDAGSWRPHTEPARFVLSEYEKSLADRAQAIADFTARREAALATERRAWQATNETAAMVA
jgi:allophanate hydrolase subunit 1